MTVDIERLQQLIEQATPAPWGWDGYRVQSDTFRSVAPKDSGWWDGTVGEQDANYQLIAELRNAAPELLAAYRERDELKAQNERLRARVLELDTALSTAEWRLSGWQGMVSDG